MPELTDPETTTADPAPTPTAIRHRRRTPRAGQLTFGWRIVTAITWVGVVIGFAAVWNASVQLGLSTWWLGPRAQPQSRLVQFLPFVPPVVVLLATVYDLRRLPWLGLTAAIACGAIALGDVGRVDGLAAVELAVAGAAAAVSVASSTGVYRDPADGSAPAGGR